MTAVSRFRLLPRPARRRPRTAPRAPHPLRTELSGAVARWAAVAMVVTFAVPLVSKADQWQGGWYRTQEELHTVAALLGGPLAAAAGCWQGGRERRARLVELRAGAPRGRLAQFVPALAPVVAGVLVGYLAAVAGALLASLPYASGRPLAWPLAADAVFLVAAASAGMVAGRLVRWRLAAPAVAVCAYVGLGVPLYGSSASVFLDPAATGERHSLPVWWQPLAMAAWTGSLACAVVLGYALRRHRYLVVLPLAAAVAAAVPIARTGADMWRPDPLAGKQVCDDATPRVCVNALDADLLPDVSQALSGITDRLAGVPNAPVRFEDLPRAPHRDETQLPDLVRGQSVVRGGLAAPEEFAWQAGALLVTRDCESLPDGPVDQAVEDWLVSNDYGAHQRKAWVKTARTLGDTGAVAAYEREQRALKRLTGMPDEERRQWLGRYLAAARDCAPGDAPTL